MEASAEPALQTAISGQCAVRGGQRVRPCGIGRDGRAGDARANPRYVRAHHRSYRLKRPMIEAFASVAKCRLNPTTAADVSALTGNASTPTANTVNR